MWAQKYRLSHINVQWKRNVMPLSKMKMLDSKWHCGSIKGTQGISSGLIDSWDFTKFSVMFHYWGIVRNHSRALSSSEHLLLGEIDEKCSDCRLQTLQPETLLKSPLWSENFWKVRDVSKNDCICILRFVLFLLSHYSPKRFRVWVTRLISDADDVIIRVHLLIIFSLVTLSLTLISLCSV